MDNVENYWGSFDSADLKKECQRRSLVANGSKTQLIERLCRSDGGAGIFHGETCASALQKLSVDEREDALRSRYSGLTNKELKSLLKEKKASQTGKKNDLVDRLVYYDMNADFRSVAVGDEEGLRDPLSVPEPNKFKDIHAQSPLPPFSRQDILLYMSQYHKDIGKADGMYNEGFLQYVRFCNEDNHTFIYGKTYAEMRKSSQYNVYCKLSNDGEVMGCTCECTHGRGTGEAHCKHVAVVLLGVAQCKKDGLVTTEQTCTQQLQQFHQPKRKFRGTPLKARDLKPSSKRKVSVLDPVPEDEDMSDEQYRSFFRNLLINGAFNKNMPLKHLLMPANPYAVCQDHTYSKYTIADLLLHCLKLVTITREEIQAIADATWDQSQSHDWHEFRLPRLTASKFYEILHSRDPWKKAVTLLAFIKFHSRATNHGIKFEPYAIAQYQQENPHAHVKASGFNISESHPFLGCTPDFEIDDDGLGEVKCPYTTRRYPVGPQYQPYLRWSKKDGTRMKLKKKHPYYYQVQGQMMVTGRQYCDFVVYTMVDSCTIRIERKENFIALLEIDLANFYDKYFKEAILNKYVWRDYDKIFMR